MPHKDPVKRAAYMREYHRKNAAKRCAYARQHHADNRDERTVHMREYRDKNIEWFRAYDRQYYAENKDRMLEANRLWRSKRDEVRGRPLNCEMCGSSERKICFDHCHTSGQFRGWLCVSCNAVLGFARDDPQLLRKLADYLDEARRREEEEW